MKLSTRSRYGFRAILELARDYGKGPLQIKEISDRQGISIKYLEQLIAILKSAGLVRSIRGPKGGYLLVKKPADVRLTEVFKVLEGPFLSLECLEHRDYCPKCSDCVTRQVWYNIEKAIESVLSSVTLSDLVEKAGASSKSLNYNI